jgi:hypothetical protein
MKLFIYLFIVIFSVFICSCGSKDNNGNHTDSEKSIIPDLTGKTLHFSDGFDTSICALDLMNDCVTWRVHFLDDSAFVCAAYCEADVSYWKGNYKVINNEVHLHDIRPTVHCIFNWFGEDVHTTPEYSFEIDSLDSRNFTLKPQFCKNQLHFSVALPEIHFGVFDSISSFDRDLDFMKEHGIWEKLK